MSDLLPRFRRADGIAAALAGVGLLIAAPAAAQDCESSRPTEAAGAAGLAYGSAEVASFDSASGLARVHYALTGAHAPPAASTLEPEVPDAVVVAARAADDALSEYAALGFVPPLADGDSPCASNGDGDAIDIYLVHFASADGQALLDHCRPGKPRRCSGFVLVENDFRGAGYADVSEGLRTVVPHELFHLVQDAYDADLERWWAEGSAQWAAKQVYPELQDLERFLPGYFDNPQRPLNEPPPGVVASFLYATAIWPVFLHERHGAALVREIYEGFAGDGASVLETTDLVLQARGSSLPRDFLQFAAYNAATGERATEDAGYRAAAEYPLVELTALPTHAGERSSGVTSGFGALYYSVASDEPVRLRLDADADRLAGLLLPLDSGQVRLDRAEALPAVLDGEGIVVLAGQSSAATDATFTLSAESPEPSAPNDDEDLGSSGCALAGGRSSTPWLPFTLLGIAISLLGRSWRTSLRKDA